MTAPTSRLALRTALLGAPVLLLLILFLVLPYGEMIVMSFRAPATRAAYGDAWTLANYVKAVSDPFYLGVLGRTLAVGTLITALTLLLSYPVALHLARVSDRWHMLFYACVVSPLLVGVLVRNFGWMIVVSFSGPLNQVLLALGLIAQPLRLLFNLPIVVLALVHVFVPFMVLPIVNALRNIEPALEDASASLGASRWETFWRVTLPLSLPGVLAGTILVFVLAVSAFVTPTLLGGQNVVLMPSIVVQQLMGAFAWPFGAALAMTLSLAVLLEIGLLILLMRPLMRRVAGWG
jgi:putative spermidine/putrescine transport system permease protein